MKNDGVRSNDKVLGNLIEILDKKRLFLLFLYYLGKEISKGNEIPRSGCRTGGM